MKFVPMGLAVLVVASAACREDPPPPPPEPPAPEASAAASAPRFTEADEKAVIADVTEAMKAGFERHELSTYMKAFTPDAQVLMTRGPERGPHDVRMDRKQLEATREVRFARAPSGVSLSTEDEKVVFDKGQARLTWTMVSRQGDMQEKAGEEYLLRKVGKSWRISRNHFWLVEVRRGGEVTRYDDATYAKLDAAVERARKSGSDRELIDALVAAHRFGEAHQVSKKLTEAPTASPDDWRQRAMLAALAGDGDDARGAMAKTPDTAGDGAVRR